MSVSVHPIICLHVLIEANETLHRKWAWHQLIRWANLAEAGPLAFRQISQTRGRKDFNG